MLSRKNYTQEEIDQGCKSQQYSGENPIIILVSKLS